MGGEMVKPDRAGKLAKDSYNLGTAHALVRRVLLDAQELQVALGPFMCEETRLDLAQLKSAASRISAANRVSSTIQSRRSSLRQ